MRRSYITLILCAFVGFFFLINASCSKKTGCPINEEVTENLQKKKYKSRTGVIPPSARKKKKKKG